jgi:hypothetical protein
MSAIMTEHWQKIDGQWHPCHSWPDLVGRRITAMSLLILILAVAGLTALAWGGLYLYEFVTHDGYGRLTAHHHPPRSHPRDPFDPRVA